MLAQSKLFVAPLVVGAEVRDLGHLIEDVRKFIFFGLVFFLVLTPGGDQRVVSRARLGIFLRV